MKAMSSFSSQLDLATFPLNCLAGVMAVRPLSQAVLFSFRMRMTLGSILFRLRAIRGQGPFLDRQRIDRRLPLAHRPFVLRSPGRVIAARERRRKIDPDGDPPGAVGDAGDEVGGAGPEQRQPIDRLAVADRLGDDLRAGHGLAVGLDGHGDRAAPDREHGVIQGIERVLFAAEVVTRVKSS